MFRQRLRTNDRVGKKAFTLVEILLGSAIAAIMGVTIYSLFWSGMALNDRLSGVHKNTMAMLLTSQILSTDLENAVNVDLSSSYPGKASFEGKSGELSFLTRRPEGIKRVTYFTDQKARGVVRGERRQTGFMSSQTLAQSARQTEFLLRQETGLSEWANDREGKKFTQVLAARVKKDSFHCRYAPFSTEVITEGPKAVVYSEQWDSSSLPMAVSCSFDLYDPKRPQAQTVFKRDIFLPQLWVGNNE